MNHHFQRSALGALTVVGAMAGMAGVAEAKTVRVKGAVVHRNHRAHSFTIADRAGHLYAVHAARAPRIGSEVSLVAVSLRDGTYRLEREHGAGRASHRLRLRGVVSHVDRRAGDFTVSDAGVSMLVTSPRRGARAADALPSVGEDVVATSTVDDQGDLQEQSVQDLGQSAGGFDLEGTIVSVDTTARTLTVTADDEDQSGQTVTVTVPSSFDITSYFAGQEVELLVQPATDGTYTLIGSADDASAQTADDQGDDQGEDPGSEDQGEQSAQSGSTTSTDTSSGDSSSGSASGSDGSSSGGD